MVRAERSKSAEETLWRSGVGWLLESDSAVSVSPRSLTDREQLDLASASTSLLFSSMMGLTVLARLYEAGRLGSVAESAEGKRELGLGPGLTTGDGAGRRRVGDGMRSLF